MKTIDVPTGKIITMQGDWGQLEFLSIGDYGKEKNIKADFLGLSNEIDGVPNGQIMPLSEKWVVTISTQYGCSMGCKFCDVPKVGAGRNVTYRDLKQQVVTALSVYPEIQATKRLNVHYARMGEPTFNEAVLSFTQDLMQIVRPYIGRSLVHPVLSTMMPRHNPNLLRYLQHWCDIKNDQYRGCAGLQISINSTDETQRNAMFNNNQLCLSSISGLCRLLPEPRGRKYALNFALADDYIVDAKLLRAYFNPENFMVKITPMHATTACKTNNIQTSDGYTKYVPYKKIEEELKEQGFDVLVFIPSKDEDESRITCGNAVLAEQKN